MKSNHSPVEPNNMSGQLNKSNTLTTSDSFVLNGSPLILIITSALFETKLEAIWVTSIGPQETIIFRN